MKKILSVLLVFIFTTSQTLACGPGPTPELPMCQEYIYHIENENQYSEYERTKELRTKVYSFLNEKIDLKSKDDYEKYIQLQNKIEGFIKTDKYPNKYDDVLCSIYVSLKLFESKAMVLSSDTVLVEDLKENNKVDLYVYSHSNSSFRSVYQDVEKVSNSEYIYMNPNQDLSEYSDDFQNAAQMIYEKSNATFITKLVEQNDKVIISYVTNRVPLEEGKYPFVGGIGIYEDGEMTFLSEGDLARPNGDVDTYQTRYILDSDSIVVEGKFCGYNGGTFKLENGSDVLHDIR